MGTTSPVILYDWAPSPFCMKARAVLAWKGVAYDKRPALSHVRDVRRRGGVGKVPALELDGRFIVDSTDIAHALEARYPDPPVLPPTPLDRARCHALEDWADESLYFTGLYYHWLEPEGRARVAAYFRRTLLGRVFFRPFAYRIANQLRGQGTARKSPEHIRRDLERNLDAVEAMLGAQPFLLGDQAWLCDLAVASQLVYLGLSPRGREALAPRTTLAAWLARLPSVSARS